MSSSTLLDAEPEPSAQGSFDMTVSGCELVVPPIIPKLPSWYDLNAVGNRRAVTPLQEQIDADDTGGQTVYMQSKLKYHRALASPSSPRSMIGSPMELAHLMHAPAHVLPPTFFVRLPFGLDKVDSEGHQGSLGFIFTIVNTMMGSTVLSLAWGFDNAGLLAAAFFTIFFGMAAFYTCSIILDIGMSGSRQVGDFSDICDKYLGTVGRNVANITSILILQGASMCYHVLIASNFQSVVLTLANHWYPDSGQLFFCCGTGNNQYLVASLVVAATVMPLMFIRDISKLAAIGSFGVFGLMYNCVFLIGSGMFNLYRLSEVPSSKLGSIKLIGGLPDMGVFVGMMGLSLFVHSVLLPIGNNHVKARSSPVTVKRDLGVAYGLAVFFYVCVGAVPALAFQLGRDVLEQYTSLGMKELPQNMLMAYGQFPIGALLGRAFLVVQITFVYPILGAVTRKQFFAQCSASGEPGMASLVIFNVCFVGLTTLVSAMYPEPGSVIGYVGAYTAVVYMLWLPILVKISALRRAGQSSWWRIAGNLALAVIGTFIVLLQFIPSK